MSRIFGGLCTLFLIVLFTPVLTRADPIVVTSALSWFQGSAVVQYSTCLAGSVKPQIFADDADHSVHPPSDDEEGD